jgi:hypothetical protein
MRKRKLDRGDPSKGMTAARVAKLDTLGFVWSESGAVASEVRLSKGCRGDVDWEAQLAKLENYQHKHGHCKVPLGWAEDPRLATWVSNQRQRKKALDRGEPSAGVTAARAAKLDKLGFSWVILAAISAARSQQHSKGSWNDARWEAQLSKLNNYKAEHGDCRVPQG